MLPAGREPPAWQVPEPYLAARAGRGVSGSEGGRRPATAGFSENRDGISPNFIHPCSSEKDVQALAGGFRSHSPHHTANWGWTRLYVVNNWKRYRFDLMA